jgi:hypothetical protein
MILETSDGPVIRIEDGVKEFADASIGTDPVTVLPVAESSGASAEAGPSSNAAVPAEGPPAYTRDPPLDAQRILDDAHPREPLDPGMTASSSASSTFTLTPHGHTDASARSADIEADVDPAYEELVQEVGMRCMVLEDEMKRKAGERRKLGQPRRSRVASRPVGNVNGGGGGTGLVTVYIDKVGRMSGNALAMGAGIAGAALVGKSIFLSLACDSASRPAGTIGTGE